MKKVNELINLLDLEKIEENFFRGQNYQAPWKRIFGGQVLAQSLHAAYQTVPSDRFAHSIHGYFILSGDISTPVVYEVDRIRNGGSFTTRRVVAIQKGRPIFNMSASFQLKQEGLDHQIKMPNVPDPDSLISDVQMAERFKESSPELYKRYSIDRPFEFRPTNYIDPTNPTDQEPYRCIWIKAVEKMGDDIRMHQEFLTYASDYGLLGTAILPHWSKVQEHDMFFASLDHAMWFHRDFRIDDWLLYALDSPSASNSRGFARGNIFNRSGKLVASVVQEGLMRKSKV